MFAYQWGNIFGAEINLVDHRPSVIAAAAVLAAFDGQLTKKTMDCKMSVISLWGSRENVSFLFIVNQWMDKLKKECHLVLVFYCIATGAHLFLLQPSAGNRDGKTQDAQVADIPKSFVVR